MEGSLTTNPDPTPFQSPPPALLPPPPPPFPNTVRSFAVPRLAIRVTSEFDSDSSLFLHKISCKLVDRLSKLKLSFQNDRNGLVGRAGSTTPDDHYRWMRPEDMNYPRPVVLSSSAPELGGEMAAALAAASIVFRDDTSYSQKLIKGAAAVFKFARNMGMRMPYSRGNLAVEPLYNSTGYWDEYIWSEAWMYYATGSTSFISFATDPRLSKNAEAFMRISPDLNVFSWDNKLPAAELLLTRLKIFLNPGYPYEDSLRDYFNALGQYMCSNLRPFNIFNWTQGGLIELNHGRPQPLQYAVNAAFLASLYVDYMNVANVSGWSCGINYYSSSTLRSFAASQLNYVLGENPRKISYVVGYEQNYPKQVHHRGASIPQNGVKYSCTGGWKWRDTRSHNPNVITGAMVGGPDHFDGFSDVRNNYNYAEPTLAGNTGLVAALMSLTSSGGGGIDKNTIFSAVSPLYTGTPDRRHCGNREPMEGE